MPRMEMFEMVMSSQRAPSSLSSAMPSHSSKTQLEMVMFLKPPFDSVPHLIRPVWGTRTSAANLLEGAVENGA